MRIDSSHPARPPYCLQSAYVIRLRGPWHWEILSPTEPPAASLAATAQASDRRSATFQAPDGLAKVLPTTLAGPFRLRLSRIFRRPTGLDAGSSVQLVIEPMATRGVLQLNSVPLGPLGPSLSRYTITEHLQITNELQLDLDFDPAAIVGQTTEGPRIDVRLEII